LTATRPVAAEAAERVFCNARIFTGEPLFGGPEIFDSQGNRLPAWTFCLLPRNMSPCGTNACRQKI